MTHTYTGNTKNAAKIGVAGFTFKAQTSNQYVNCNSSFTATNNPSSLPFVPDRKSVGRERVC